MPATTFTQSGARWADSPEVNQFIDKFNIPKAHRQLLHPRLHPLGSGLSLHAYQYEVLASTVPLDEFSETFAKVSIGEYKEGLPMFSISIFHGAGCDIPDPMDYFPSMYPDLQVKVKRN